MLRAYKYRIYPTKDQQELIEKTFGCCRLVYNLALETKIEAYKKGVQLSSFDLCYQLVELKKGFTWLKEVDSQALQASVKKIDVAFKNFFRGNGFPKYKNRHTKQSFQCPNNTRRINWNEDTLDLPKMKGVPIVLSRIFKGKIKTVTVSRTPTGKYFASVLVDTMVKKPKKAKVKPSTTIGIDLGLSHFIITDNGIKVDNPRYLREAMSRLKVLQHRASKKQKGSNNRKKANLKVAIHHEKVTNKRMDFLHKVSKKLVDENQAICVENLSVSNMVKNHNLAQAITDVSWSKFVELLKYKSDWYGKSLIQIDKFEPTTKTCSNCGFVNEKLTLKDRAWQCNVCGEKHDRDINAALNVKQAGLLTTGVGSPKVPVEPPSVEGAVKQECNIYR